MKIPVFHEIHGNATDNLEHSYPHISQFKGLNEFYENVRNKCISVSTEWGLGYDQNVVLSSKDQPFCCDTWYTLFLRDNPLRPQLLDFLQWLKAEYIHNLTFNGSLLIIDCSRYANESEMIDITIDKHIEVARNGALIADPNGAEWRNKNIPNVAEAAEGLRATLMGEYQVAISVSIAFGSLSAFIDITRWVNLVRDSDSFNPLEQGGCLRPYWDDFVKHCHALGIDATVVGDPDGSTFARLSPMR